MFGAIVKSRVYAVAGLPAVEVRSEHIFSLWEKKRFAASIVWTTMRASQIEAECVRSALTAW